MLPYNPYTNSKGLFNPRVMVRPGGPSVLTQQAGTPQAGAHQVNHPRRSKVTHLHPDPTRGSSSEKHRVDTTPGDAFGSGRPARKKSRVDGVDTANREASSSGMNIETVPSELLRKIFKWQVKEESTAVIVKELANLDLVSKGFRNFFHSDLINEGIRHAARTGNHSLLKYLCPKAQTMNFPAWDFALGPPTSCEASSGSLTPIGAPLHEAAGANDAIGVALLLAAGASPNFIDCRHETALHRAAKSGGPLVFAQLIRADGNPEIRNLHLWTAFDVAIASKNVGVVYAICRLGRHIDGRKAPTGSSFLHKALEADCLSTLKVVLTFKPKLNVKDWSGATPLIYAIREGKSPNAVEMIMKLSPNALLKDRAGKTALFYTQVRKDVASRDLFARYFCGPAFNKGLREAQKACYRRYETTPGEFSFVYHY